MIGWWHSVRPWMVAAWVTFCLVVGTNTIARGAPDIGVPMIGAALVMAGCYRWPERMGWFSLAFLLLLVVTARTW